MTEASLTLIYTIFCIAVLYKHRFFHLPEISKHVVVAAFVLKILFGLALWWIYTFYYTDRSKADIYKYYDDSRVLYDLLFEHPIHFLQILFGVNNGADQFHYVYDQMYNWYSPFATHLYNANQAIIKINAVMHIFSFGNFNVHTVLFCFLSFIGQIAIYKTFYPYLSDKKWGLFAAVFLLPTVLFWGSGVLKEGIILFGLGIFIYSLHQIIFKKPTIKMFLILLLGLWAIIIMKVYILIALFPGIILLLWVKLSGYKYMFLKYTGVVTLMVLMGYSIGFFSNNYNAAQMLSFRQKDFYNAMRGGVYFQRFINNSEEYDNIYFPASRLPKFKNVEREDTIHINFTDTAYVWDVMNYVVTDTILVVPSENIKYRLVFKDVVSGSGIAIPELKPTYTSLLVNSPMAFVNTLVRPHPFEFDSFFSVIAGFENILIEIIIIFCAFFIRIPKNTEHLMVLFAFSFVLMLFVLTGLVTPIIGAIVRYKMPALPFLIITLLLITDKQKMTSFLSLMVKKTRIPFTKF